MTESVKVPTSDDEMEDYLKEQDFKRLTIAQGRAEKWVGSITALTGLVGLVSILKGPDSTSKLSATVLNEVGVALGWSFGLLVLGVLLTSAAAYGVPFLAGTVERQSEGVLGRALNKIKTYARASRVLLTIGVLCVVVGLAALLLASWKTWIPPAATTPGTELVCISVNGAVVAKINGSSLDIRELNGASVAPCA